MMPAYIETARTGELRKRTEEALAALAECRLCPRECGVNRLENERGVCRTGRRAVVCSFSPHFGEEDPLVGTMGSGTIFFSHCNLRCVFCQNWEISHLGEGGEVEAGELAEMMLDLQRRGCHNINFVTPTHVVAQILEALEIAVEGGLQVPLVYNTGGYDKVETLRLLDGVVDIYMPDIKYASGAQAGKYSKAPDYPEAARAAVLEMHRQVGDLQLDRRGIASRGLLVRHLVMPRDIAGTREVMRFLAREVSKDTYVNVMAQYRPCGDAHKFPEIARRITAEEYEAAVRAAEEEGIHRLDERRLPRIFRLL
jgi:putative pyruvate formate lyase activating enzyme